MEKQLNSSGICLRIFVIEDSSGDPKRFRKKEHQARRVHGPNHLHVNVQRHCMVKKRTQFSVLQKWYQNQGSTVFILISLKTEIARSVKGPKLQGPHAEDPMAEPHLVQKSLVT